MVDSDFWRDLAEKFHKVDPYQVVRADGSYRIEAGAEAPVPAAWELLGSRDPRSAFESLARRGGLKIDPQMDSLIA
jgi:hypothetical protein